MNAIEHLHKLAQEAIVLPEVGNYARTEYGIDKIIGYRHEPEYENCHVLWFEKSDSGSRYTDKNLIKSSPNIIDLIEENDLLKIEYFSLRYNKRVTRLFEVTYKDNKNIVLDNAKCSFMLINNNFNDEDKKLKPIIKSVLTHEQFEAMKYKVGDTNVKD